jgi:hypothetical protein
MRRFPLLLLLLSAVSCSAQIYYFGRNKVQYTNFAWHVLKTPHFDIYYYPEIQELAELLNGSSIIRSGAGSR